MKWLTQGQTPGNEITRIITQISSMWPSWVASNNFWWWRWWGEGELLLFQKDRLSYLHPKMIHVISQFIHVYPGHIFFFFMLGPCRGLGVSRREVMEPPAPQEANRKWIPLPPALLVIEHWCGKEGHRAKQIYCILLAVPKGLREGVMCV